MSKKQYRIINTGKGVMLVTLADLHEVGGIATSDYVQILADSLNDGFLSSADFIKLASIETGAQVNVNTDWLATSGDAELLNKPVLNFEYDQPTPALVWTIIHNMNKKPSVTVIDSAGTTIEGEVHYIDNTTLTVSFNSGFSGTATLN